MKLVYGYFNKEKTEFKVIETLVNQGTKELCSYIKTQKKLSRSYKDYEFMIVSSNGLRYNYKFKY